MQHVLQYYYNITLNKTDIYGTHGTMKSDSGGLIRGLQRPRVSNALFYHFQCGAMEGYVTVHVAVNIIT